MVHKTFDLDQLGKKSWFPGHMKKTLSQMANRIKLVDVVLEVRDARVPQSSRNDHFEKVLGNRKRLIIFTKKDIADPKYLPAWEEYFKKSDTDCMFIDCIAGTKPSVIISRARKLVQKPTGRIKLMIVGIPNVGKSTLLNRLVGRKAAKTGFLPGITRSEQWVRVDNGTMLLDTAGVLYPGNLDNTTALRLSLTGGIKGELYSIVDQAHFLFEEVICEYEGLDEEFKRVYKLPELPESFLDCLEQVGRKRGALLAGGVVDTEKAARIIVDGFRRGKLGRVTLDRLE